MCASDNTHGDVNHHHNFALKNSGTPAFPTHLPPTPHSPLMNRHSSWTPSIYPLPSLATHRFCLTDRWCQPEEGMDCTIHLQTFLLQPLHSLLPLLGDPTHLLGRQQNRAGCSPKKGQAMLLVWWGAGHRRSIVNIAIALVPWLQIHCKL